jgi:phospholipase C
MHAATSDRSVDIELGFYESKTVFQLLDEAKVGTSNAPAWRLYHDDTPQLIAYPYVWDADHLPRWHPMEDLATHAKKNQLAPYSFIEPRHSGGHTTSQHPGNNESNSPDENGKAGNDFRRSERLIRDVYNALRPRLHDTMLIITYDEHGGFFDHVAPPRSPAPKPIKKRAGRVLTRSRLFIGWFIEHRNTPFHFHRYGIRVPAVIVSNWIAPGTLVDDCTFDHTSVAATLRRLFAPIADPLTVRDERANTLEYLVLSASSHRPDLPDLPHPPDDDGGPSDDPPIRPPAAPSPSAAGAPTNPRRPPPTRTNDGARRARPTTVRVDADLADQLEFLSAEVEERLAEIERRYGMESVEGMEPRRGAVQPSVGERLQRDPAPAQQNQQPQQSETQDG